MATEAELEDELNQQPTATAAWSGCSRKHRIGNLSTKSMGRSGAAAEFNEIVALLRRNDVDGNNDEKAALQQRDARDVEDDLKRLLLMSRDSKQRDEMIQAQALRRITLIARQRRQDAVLVARICAALLCNLAQSERGRLSASSCDRWYCVSHRHNCPLAMLLYNTLPSQGCDLLLRQLSAAALLSFSVQNECQMQLDAIASMPLLLRILQDMRDDADVRVYVAAILWNLTKSPLLMLKIETIHGMLKDTLVRKLTDVLWTPLEPFHLSVTPTGERGTGGLIESDSPENLGVMLAASTSTQLAVMLRVENYVGRARSLRDQYRAKTPLLGAGKRADPSQVIEGQSTANFDESGVLKSRSCAVCGKAIRLKRKRVTKAGKLLYVECARDGCEQTFHPACCRWKQLGDERIKQHAAEFHCAVCMLQLPGVNFNDFIADSAKHELLLTEMRFKSVEVLRVAPRSDPAIASLNGDNAVYSALLDKQTQEVVAVGLKKYRIPPSSQDLEMFVVDVKYTRVNATPATQQAPASSSGTTIPSPVGGWSVSYAREGAVMLPATPGNAVFWPGPFVQDLDASLYTQRSLADLDSAFLYEFQGESPQDKVYSFGIATASLAAVPATPVVPSAIEPLTKRLWSSLQPRRGICMKLLTEQIGRHKQLNDLLQPGDGRTSSPAATTTTRKPKAKPHIAGKKLNRVAVAVSGQ